MARADRPIMQWQGNPRNLPIRDGSISLNWSALGKWDPHSKIGLVWKFQLEPRMDLGNGHTVTLTVSFRSSRRVIVQIDEQLVTIFDEHGVPINEPPSQPGGVMNITEFLELFDEGSGELCYLVPDAAQAGGISDRRGGGVGPEDARDSAPGGLRHGVRG